MTIPRIHLRVVDGDREVYRCPLDDCDHDGPHAGAELVGWIERGRTLQGKYSALTEWRFTPTGSAPAGPVYLGQYRRAVQDARDHVGAVAAEATTLPVQGHPWPGAA